VRVPKEAAQLIGLRQFHLERTITLNDLSIQWCNGLFFAAVAFALTLVLTDNE
jgi:hypothetical protein